MNSINHEITSNNSINITNIRRLQGLILADNNTGNSHPPIQNWHSIVLIHKTNQPHNIIVQILFYFLGLITYGGKKEGKKAK